MRRNIILTVITASFCYALDNNKEFNKLNNYYHKEPPGKAPEKICMFPIEVGYCIKFIKRWASVKGQCREFYYSGCGGNGNNFKSLEQCVKKCENHYKKKDNKKEILSNNNNIINNNNATKNRLSGQAKPLENVNSTQRSKLNPLFPFLPHIAPFQKLRKLFLSQYSKLKNKKLSNNRQTYKENSHKNLSDKKNALKRNTLKERNDNDQILNVNNDHKTGQDGQVDCLYDDEEDKDTDLRINKKNPFNTINKTPQQQETIRIKKRPRNDLFFYDLIEFIKQSRRNYTNRIRDKQHQNSFFLQNKKIRTMQTNHKEIFKNKVKLTEHPNNLTFTDIEYPIFVRQFLEFKLNEEIMQLLDRGILRYRMPPSKKIAKLRHNTHASSSHVSNYVSWSPSLRISNIIKQKSKDLISVNNAKRMKMPKSKQRFSPRVNKQALPKALASKPKHVPILEINTDHNAPSPFLRDIAWLDILKQQSDEVTQGNFVEDPKIYGVRMHIHRGPWQSNPNKPANTNESDQTLKMIPSKIQGLAFIFKNTFG